MRQELRRQIGRLEAELASYTRAPPASCRPRRAARSPTSPACEELEQTRDTLIAQLSEAQKEAEQRVRQEARTQAGRSAGR